MVIDFTTKHFRCFWEEFSIANTDIVVAVINSLETGGEKNETLGIKIERFFQCFEQKFWFFLYFDFCGENRLRIQRRSTSGGGIDSFFDNFSFFLKEFFWNFRNTPTYNCSIFLRFLQICLFCWKIAYLQTNSQKCNVNFLTVLFMLFSTDSRYLLQNVSTIEKKPQCCAKTCQSPSLRCTCIYLLKIPKVQKYFF